MNEIIAKDTNGALQKIYTPPAGEIMLFAGNNVPDGWLPCNGALVNRSAYPELFEAIDTIYGTGDGSTTFGLPNTEDRFPRFAGNGLSVGDKQGDAIRNIAGLTGGEDSYCYRPAYTSGAFFVPDGASNFIVQYVPTETPFNGWRLGIDASLVVPTAAENRPKAIAFKACIKY